MCVGSGYRVYEREVGDGCMVGDGCAHVWAAAYMLGPRSQLEMGGGGAGGLHSTAHLGNAGAVCTCPHGTKPHPLPFRAAYTMLPPAPTPFPPDSTALRTAHKPTFS